MGRWAPVALVLFATTVVRSAGAQSAQSEASVAAEALFVAGRADVDRGDYASACPKFADSQRLDPAAGTLINLADCEEHVGQLGRAWQHWREALERLPEGDPRRSVVAGRGAAADARVPRLTIVLAKGAPTDIVIRRDELELGSSLLGVAVPLDPGRHTVTLEARGHLPSRQDVFLPEGARATVELSPGPPVVEGRPEPASTGSAQAPQAAVPSPEKGGLSVLGLASLGVGAVGLVTGGVTGLLAIDRKNEQEKRCFPIHVCTPEGAAAAREGETFALVSTISFAVGAVAAAAGVYLVLRSRGGDRRVALAPLVSLDTVGLAARFP